MVGKKTLQERTMGVERKSGWKLRLSVRNLGNFNRKELKGRFTKFENNY
jgi:hypothetical protein